jgi:ribosomal protein L11 methyltransferase
MNMRWAKITVDAEAGAIDAVGNCLNDIGGGGFAVDDESVPARISGYVPVDDRLELRLDQLSAALAALAGYGIEGAGTEITLTYVEEEDWANAWKAFYKPIRVGAHLVVTPAWMTPPNEPGDINIIMDPGMAFGTGSHPSTQLCLAALEDYVRPGMHVADVGTGSGILSIAAARLGATLVRGTDIDPIAITVATKNAETNGVAAQFALGLPDGIFDVIVSNILADVIIGLADNLTERLEPHGTLIVSGIIDTRESDVADALTSRGMTLLEIRRDAEWVAIIMRNGGS